MNGKRPETSEALVTKLAHQVRMLGVHVREERVLIGKYRVAPAHNTRVRGNRAVLFDAVLLDKSPQLENLVANIAVQHTVVEHVEMVPETNLAAERAATPGTLALVAFGVREFVAAKTVQTDDLFLKECTPVWPGVHW